MRKIFTLFLLITSIAGFSQSTTVVISQVYSGGGSGTAPVTYKADYVELHNVSSVSQNIGLYSVQYGSSTGNFGNTGSQKFNFPASTIIPAGGYLLIQLGSPGTAGGDLPVTADFTTTNASMGATSGKVALVNDTTSINCGATATACTLPNAAIIDLVSWGTSNNAEGGAAVADLSKTTGAVRKVSGCQDTDNNAADFDIVTNPIPRNSASAVFICGGGPPSPSITAGTVVDFGSVVILTNSASQSFNLTGANLTGAPGVITITSPSVDFQVSNNNTTWGATTTVPYTTATLASTPVWVRFTPQTVGPKSGNITITGGGIATAVVVAVSGNGITGGGASASASALAAFGAVCINTTGGPNSFSLTGTNLTAADLVVGPLSGYTFSTTSGGAYTNTLTLVHPAGNYTQTIFVQFTPTAANSYNGNITVTGGGLTAPLNVPVTGSGSAGTATVATGSASAITQVSATLAGSISSQGCSPVTAYGFEYSLVSGFVTGTVAASTNLATGNFSAGIAGLTPGTTYYYKAFATNAGGTVYGMEMSFMTAAPPAATLSATALVAFGSTCVGEAIGPNDFTISGTNLTTGSITVGPLNGYSFSATATGTYTSSLVLNQPGGTYTQTVYVKFLPPAIGTFDGNIPVSGAGATPFSVAASGTANNAASAPITEGTDSIMPNSATARGSFTNSGCGTVFSYGIEYSGVNGFSDGFGFKVESGNLSGTTFSSKLNNLVPNTTYYYKAYATSSAGTTYGLQNSFTTGNLPGGLVIYSVPVIRGQNLRYSLNGVKQGHYSARIHNSLGQLVFQKDIIIQVNFIDDSFILPATFPIGLYNLEIRNYEYKIQKSFFVQ